MGRWGSSGYVRVGKVYVSGGGYGGLGYGEWWGGGMCEESVSAVKWK